MEPEYFMEFIMRNKSATGFKMCEGHMTSADFIGNPTKSYIEGVLVIKESPGKLRWTQLFTRVLIG